MQLAERRGVQPEGSYRAVVYELPKRPVEDHHVEDDDHELTAQDPIAMAAEADCVVVVTDHAGVDYAAIVDRAKLIVDTRNALKNHPSPKIVRL